MFFSSAATTSSSAIIRVPLVQKISVQSLIMRCPACQSEPDNEMRLVVLARPGALVTCVLPFQRTSRPRVHLAWRDRGNNARRHEEGRRGGGYKNTPTQSSGEACAPW